jgi:hypothetical protein
MRIFENYKIKLSIIKLAKVFENKSFYAGVLYKKKDNITFIIKYETNLISCFLNLLQIARGK